MTFVTDETCTHAVELNTLAELQAYALGGNGMITIDFLNHHPATGEKTSPVIKKGRQKNENS